MFSGGLDLKLLPTLSRDGLRELSAAFARIMLRVFTFPIPTVAAVTGHAIAGGAVLAYACDRRYAVDGRFRLQLNEVAIGIPMPSWMATIAAAAIPRHLHVEALLHAHAFAPAEAFAHGILNGLVAEGEDAVRHATEQAADLVVAAARRLRDVEATPARRRRRSRPGAARRRARGVSERRRRAPSPHPRFRRRPPLRRWAPRAGRA